MNRMVQDAGADASKWLDEQSNAMETALAELVRVNSFTENVEGGAKVCRMLEELFTAEGLISTRVSGRKCADHLIVRSSSGAAGAAPVALIGHYDTVFPPGTFEGYRRDGELARGPGVLDMKGGLVVVAWALKALSSTIGLAALPEIRVVVVADEELGSPEGAAVIRDTIDGSQSALVFESGRPGDVIITRRKGAGIGGVVARGKAAHSGNAHQDGANAIWALSRFVDRAQSLTDYSRGVTVNVGTIKGGTSRNTVPDRAEALAEIRFEKRADGEALVAALKRVAEECEAAVPGTSVDVDIELRLSPLERTPASARLMEAYAEHARASGLGASEAPVIGGGSDAATASSMGIATIDGLGPRGVGFHTKDEHIEIATLVMKAKALARFLAALRSRA